MRVAALYDIHGNLPALEAVLAEVRKFAVDQIVVVGDVVPGPMPGECLECLLHLDLPVKFISGNGEVAVLAELAGQRSQVPEQFREAVRWSGNQLSASQVQAAANWPKTLHQTINGIGRVLFCHATPRDENENFTQVTEVNRLLPIFHGLEADLVICGHTHMQFDRVIGDVRVVNAGSVGMPFGKPGAYWALLGPEVQLQRTNYDLEQAAADIRSTNYPQARTFANDNVLHPPSEIQMLELLA
ncbi:MAG: phosphoesterase [Chthoniobacterales bacterium]|nr:MAG: phosphoesterase [Chthoniobacterales bacterium]